MDKTSNIVAIELCSTKIQAIAAKKDNFGSLSVLAYAKASATEFMKRGRILNIDMAAEAIRSVKESLEEQIGSKIDRAYVAFSGQGTRSQINTASAGIGDQDKVTQEIVDQLYEENKAMAEDNGFVLDVEPQEYQVDSNRVKNPVGTRGASITGTYLNILVSRDGKENIDRCMEEAGLESVDISLIPRMKASALLQRDEIRSGCALVDLGAQTTTVSVYKNSLLRYLCVLPFGQDNITRDLESLKMEHDKAEELKIEHADGDFVKLNSMSEDSKDETYAISEGGGATVSQTEFHRVIRARLMEIAKNVERQIELSTYKDNLISGIKLTGGGADLKNIEEVFRQLFKNSIRKIQKGDVAYSSRVLLPGDQEIAALLGMLQFASDDCFQNPIPKELEPSNEQSLLEPLTDEEPAFFQQEPQETIKPAASSGKKKPGLFTSLGGFFEKLSRDEELTPEEEEKREQERREKEEKKRLQMERKALERERKEQEKARKDAERRRMAEEQSKEPGPFGNFVNSLFSDQADDQM